MLFRFKSEYDVQVQEVGGANPLSPTNLRKRILVHCSSNLQPGWHGVYEFSGSTPES